MSEKIEQIRKELQQINQQIQIFKAMAYDKIVELEIAMQQKQAAPLQPVEPTEKGAE